ncbi:MAG: flagellar assembly protein FliW [Melioribacteraceae bacterium]|nr:flagellar assembly protein FliW [Melioribacteraceae bacterium]
MKIITTQFGEIEVSEDQILTFNEGFYAFEELKKYVLIQPDNSYFKYLTSVDRPEIAFPLFATRLLDENYPQIDKHEAFGIVTLNKDPLKITVNLRAPVYINQYDKSGYHTILEGENYSFYYNLFVE